MSLYRAFVPPGAAGAGKNHFDIFNVSGSGLDLILLSVQPVVSGSVAVTSTLAVDLFLARTSAAGTGGTASTYEGTSLTAMTISGVNNSSPLTVGQVSGMINASGGATIGAVLSMASVFTEETNSGAYTPAADLVGARSDADGVIVKPGSGFKVIQGSVASVGNIGFNVVFRIVRK